MQVAISICAKARFARDEKGTKRGKRQHDYRRGGFNLVPKRHPHEAYAASCGAYVRNSYDSDDDHEDWETESDAQNEFLPETGLNSPKLNEWDDQY